MLVRQHVKMLVMQQVRKLVVQHVNNASINKREAARQSYGKDTMSYQQRFCANMLI